MARGLRLRNAREFAELEEMNEEKDGLVEKAGWTRHMVDAMYGPEQLSLISKINRRTRMIQRLQEWQ